MEYISEHSTVQRSVAFESFNSVVGRWIEIITRRTGFTTDKNRINMENTNTHSYRKRKNWKRDRIKCRSISAKQLKLIREEKTSKLIWSIENGKIWLESSKMVFIVKSQAIKRQIDSNAKKILISWAMNLCSIFFAHSQYPKTS